MNKYDIYSKAIKVIDSCENLSQFYMALNFAALAIKETEKEFYDEILDSLVFRFSYIMNDLIFSYRSYIEIKLTDKLLNNK